MRTGEYERLQELRRNCCRRISESAGQKKRPAVKTACAYAALLAKKCRMQRFDSLAQVVERLHAPEPVERALMHLLSPGDLQSVRRLAEQYSEDQLAAYVLFCSRGECPPDEKCAPHGLAVLGASLVELESGMTAADICCGDGMFLVDTYPELSGLSVTAFEPKTREADLALLRASLLGSGYRVLCRDVLSGPGDAKFDRIYIHPPIAAQKELVEYRPGPAAEQSRTRKIIAGMSHIWLYLGTAVEMLKPGGKAVAFLPTTALNQRVDRDIRASYIRSGFVEAVILLPESLQPRGETPAAILILSRGNDEVRMVDARRMAAHRGRETFLDVQHTHEIADSVKICGEHSVLCTVEDLENAAWSLLPTRYMNRAEIPDGRPLEEVAIRIERGAQMSVKKLDELRSAVPTNCKYLRIADIEDGVVCADESADYLSEIPDVAKNRCMKNRTVVLSRLGTPAYKSGVAHVKEEEMVLASGNVYLIDVDEEKMDPYFLQAFLQSEAGTASLKRLGGTSAVSPISLADLRKLIVPVPPMEVQKRIAEEYRVLSKKCIELRAALFEYRENLHAAYENGLG